MVRSVYQPQAGESTLTIMPKRHLDLKSESLQSDNSADEVAMMQLRMPKRL